MARKSNIDSTPISGVYPDERTGEAPYRVVFRFLDRTGAIKQSSRRNFPTVQEANEFRRTKERELEQAQTPIDDQITLKDYLDIWKERYVLPCLKATTIDGYLNCIRIIQENLGQIRLCKLNHSTINSFYLDLQQPTNGEPMALNSIRYVKRVLHKALEDAILEKIIRENPSKGVRLIGKSNTVYKTFTKSEVSIIRNAIKGTALYVPVSLSVSLGLRRCEALGLRWEDINFESGIISIRQTLVMTSAGPILETPKTKHSIRDIPMPGQIKVLLLAEKEMQISNRSLLGSDYHDNDYVCCKANGDPYVPNYITHRFKDSLKPLPVPKIRYHDLRHTFATIALENNVPLKVVSYLLGHSNIAVTGNIYSHVTEPLARKHSDTIAAAIFD